MSAGVSPWQQLADAGLNRQHVFALADLPPEIRQQIAAQDGETQLILLGHAGRLLWEKVQAAQRAQAVDAAGVLVQPCRQAHPVGKTQAGQGDGVFHARGAPGPLQGGAVALGQCGQGQFVGSFGIEAKQKWSSQRIGKKRHWIIRRSFTPDFPP